MPQVPILKGIYSDQNADYRTAYPRNLVPVPKEQGLSRGYLRPAPGIVGFATGPGLDRGGRIWRDKCYRVMGSDLVLVDEDGTVTIIGDVGAGAGLRCTLDNSFDYLSITSANNLFLYDGATLAQVTDPDLGPVIDAVWLDGYFFTTDGDALIVTQLNDPFSVNPLTYAASEIDPDPVVGVKELRNEIAAINRYTVEYFDNVGGGANQFPFRRIDGAQLQRGCVGTHANAIFAEALAFIGSARRETIGVWLGRSGQTTKLSTREIDQILKTYTEAELSLAVLEAIRDDNHEFLFMHLPDQTLVYDLTASQTLGMQVWHTRDSGVDKPSQYRAFNYVRVYDKWLCGDPTSNQVGYFDESISTHYGQTIGWEFSTQIMYNEGMGFQVHEVKLSGLTGRAPLGKDPTIYTNYSTDGETWSEEKPKKAGRMGQRHTRLEWNRQGYTAEQRIQRFSGTSDAHIGVARLDVRIEGLAF